MILKVPAVWSMRDHNIEFQPRGTDVDDHVMRTYGNDGGMIWENDEAGSDGSHGN